ncbi:MAG: hypothetical protein EPO06_09385 [Burkholderiaceae bacterium]|nr:MAG: hypothetical protein EPO06_09385 [Burkholderiaceae bacterium]
MDFSIFVQNLQSTLGTHLPALAAALGILIAGWILAVVARAASRHLLKMLKVDQRLSDSTQQTIPLEAVLNSTVFWLVMLLTLIGILNVLDLQTLSLPFADLVRQVLGYLPHLLAGALLALLAYVLASVVRYLSGKALRATALDERLTRQAGMPGASKNAADVLFWVVILLFLPMVLEALQLYSLLQPVQAMMEKTLLMAPNLFAALVLGFVGWLIASVVRGLVSNVLQASGADHWSEKAGMSERVPISKLAGMLAFILIFVPILIAALDALKIEAISTPATHMLDQILAAVPNIVAAALILLITWYVARFAAGLLEKLLATIGADALPEKLGCAECFSASLKPSHIVGVLVLFFAMLFAAMEAANRLGFSQLATLVGMFTVFGGKVLLGLAIFIIGYWLAQLAYRVVEKGSGSQSVLWARLTRAAILGLVLAMGLQAMEVAENIVNLAFALTLGAVAVAFALAFGLGGREAAGKLMEHWIEKLKR